MKTRLPYPALSESYRNLFPFRLATTSFIYPDTYANNVRMLAPYVDEIELLMFESAAASLPSKKDISELCLLADDFDITFNVHLPYDVPLDDTDPIKRTHAADAIQHVIELTAPLWPSTLTLHLPYNEAGCESGHIKAWQENICEGMNHILTSGIDSRKISIETLAYPFKWTEPVVKELNLSVCLDIGHLMRFGYNVNDAFNRYADITTIIHLHGIENRQDHVALNNLSENELNLIWNILNRYKGIMSVEVFSFKHLETSLKLLKKKLALPHVTHTQDLQEP